MSINLFGEIKFSDLNVEFGRVSNAYISLAEAEQGLYNYPYGLNVNSINRPNGFSPYSINEFHGYDNNAAESYANVYVDISGYDIPSDGDNFIEIYDNYTMQIIYSYVFTNGTTNIYETDLISFTVGHYYTIINYREDLNYEYPYGSTYAGINNNDLSIDLMSSGFIDGSTYCQSFIETPQIQNTNDLYLYLNTNS